MGYFNQLRRKIGVVTLVVACVFAAAWARSIVVSDCLVVNLSRTTSVSLWSVKGDIGWEHYEDRLENWRPYWWKWSHPKGYLGPFNQINWKFCGITSSEAEWSKHEFCSMLSISYGSIVIPLTLLSAWLLLSKPRVRKMPTVAKPATDSLS